MSNKHLNTAERMTDEKEEKKLTSHKLTVSPKLNFYPLLSQYGVLPLSNISITFKHTHTHT